MDAAMIFEERDYVRVVVDGSRGADDVSSMLRQTAHLCARKALSGIVCTIGTLSRHTSAAIYLGMRDLAELWSGGSHRIAFVCTDPAAAIDCEYAVLIASYRRVEAKVLEDEESAARWVRGPASPGLASI
jgi:hypothetical protein